MAAFFNCCKPGFGRPVLARRNPRASQSQPAMSAGADADIIATPPINEIVAALIARPCMVGDLVSRQAGGGETIPGRFVESGCRLLIRQREGATTIGALECRIGFDGELIEREMSAGERQRL